jgi:hypothetical protein
MEIYLYFNKFDVVLSFHIFFLIKDFFEVSNHLDVTFHTMQNL